MAGLTRTLTDPGSYPVRKLTDPGNHRRAGHNRISGIGISCNRKIRTAHADRGSAAGCCNNRLGGWENCALVHRRNAALQPPRCRSQMTSPVTRAAEAAGPPIYLQGARSGDLGPCPAADRSGKRSLTRDLITHARADPAHGPNLSDPAVHHQPPTEVENSQDQAPRWPMDYTEPELTPAGGLSRFVTSPAKSGRPAVWTDSDRPTGWAKSGVRQAGGRPTCPDARPSGELPSHNGHSSADRSKAGKSMDLTGMR